MTLSASCGGCSDDDSPKVEDCPTVEESPPVECDFEQQITRLYVSSPEDIARVCHNRCDRISLLSARGDNVVNFKGLEHIRSINELEVEQAQGFKNFKGLEGVKTIGEIHINNNWALESLEGLDNLELIFPADSSEPAPGEITGNPKLKNLNGLANLKEIRLRKNTGISEDLFIRDNESLESIEGLRNLESASGLRITRNNKLTSLKGLEKLRHVDTVLSVGANESLTSFEHLGSLEFVGEVLSFGSNPKVKQCAVEAYLAGLGLPENTQFMILNNGPEPCDAQ